MVRWYVLQVTTGQETGVRDALQTLGIRAAVPREERAIRSGGGWTTKVYTLLPGYVFLALEYSAENYYRVKAIPHVLRFLGSNGLSPSYLTHLEVEWLRLLDNGGEPLKPSGWRNFRRTVFGSWKVCCGTSLSDASTSTSAPAAPRWRSVYVGSQKTITLSTEGGEDESS